MTHPTQQALDAVRALEETHRYAHTCTQPGLQPTTSWVRNDQTCWAWSNLQTIRASLEVLHERVHAAAHTSATVDTVAAAMLAGPLTDLETDQQDAWRQLTRLAIERLSEVLDRDPEVEARAAAVAERLVSRG